MRKIEKAMCIAVNSRNSWKSDNTTVGYAVGLSTVYLHGHRIATIDHIKHNQTVDADTLAKYPTRTTKSRLNALGFNVTTKKGVTYLDNAPL